MQQSITFSTDTREALYDITDGRLGLSRWQSIFFCEFDGPRRERTAVVTVGACQ